MIQLSANELTIGCNFN